MPGDATIPLPTSSGGPTLDAEQYTNASSVTVNRERTASVPGVPTKMQTTLDHNLLTTSGDNTIVAGVAAQTIRVMRMILSSQQPVNVSFKDGTGGSVIGGPYYLGAYGSVTLDDTGEPWFVTSATNNLVANLSNNANVTLEVWITQS